jgi:hypothetical protein
MSAGTGHGTISVGVGVRVFDPRTGMPAENRPAMVISKQTYRRASAWKEMGNTTDEWEQISRIATLNVLG